MRDNNRSSVGFEDLSFTLVYGVLFAEPGVHPHSSVHHFDMSCLSICVFAMPFRFTLSYSSIES